MVNQDKFQPTKDGTSRDFYFENSALREQSRAAYLVSVGRKFPPLRGKMNAMPAPTGVKLDEKSRIFAKQRSIDVGVIQLKYRVVRIIQGHSLFVI